jgi:hypothetical protein
MQRAQWLLGMLVAVVGLASPAMSQESEAPAARGWDVSAMPELPSSGNVTPEMWFYIQEYNRHKSPEEAVRRKAELRSAQRQQRLESQRWFGFTNLRPPASPVPYLGTYSPSWTGGGWNPYRWHGTGTPYVTYHTATQSR